jgi:hypothetical protein
MRDHDAPFLLVFPVLETQPSTQSFLAMRLSSVPENLTC